MKKQLIDPKLVYFARFGTEDYENIILQTELPNRFGFLNDDPVPEHCQIINVSLSKEKQKPKGKKQVWKEIEDILFFKFLGLYQVLFPDQFLIWKANKKNIFTAMEKVIKTKDRKQCKLKFRSLRRKHQKPKKKKQQFSCMKSLILEKLKVYSDFDEECDEIIELMVNEKKKNINLNLLSNIEMIKKTIMFELNYETSNMKDGMIESSSEQQKIFQNLTKIEIIDEFSKYFSEQGNKQYSFLYR